jgi:hypothetical protein
MSADFDRLEREVEEQTTVIASVVELLGKLAQEVRDLGGPKAGALADKIDANTNALSAAVTAGTAAEGEPPAPPVDPQPQV